MKNQLLKLIAAAGMLIVGLNVAQALQTAGPHRPAAVPADYVITPFGYFHPSCVVHLAQGDLLQASQNVIRHQDGSTLGMHQCGFPHYRGDGARVVGDEHGVTDPNISHSWIVSESVTNSSSYGFISAEWSVPPTPPSNDGQTLYYFPGLEDSKDVVTILQPVLGWNSDYLYAWGIASWNCCNSGSVFEAPPVQVSPGDTILGYIFDTCSVGTKSCSTFDIVTQDLRTGQYSAYVNAASFGQTFNWAFGGVLEVYNVAQCSDYPNNANGFNGGAHNISFNEIGLYDYKFNDVASPAWKLTYWDKSGTPQCGYGGSVPKQVNLTY